MMRKNILYKQRRALRIPNLQLSDEQLKNFALVEIEKLLVRNESSLRRFASLAFPDEALNLEGNNKLIQEELHRDILAIEHSVLLSSMTFEQKKMSLMKLRVLFLYGFGGTEKTYIWRALASEVRLKGGIVIRVALSGIVSLLIRGGRTTHSPFCIPLNVDEESICHIKAGSLLIELLVVAKLIIWDKTPLFNKNCFEALD
ncbi:LOW QUALITY PROTEIN: hypothetical protein V2J09_000615 [Rumex salicifolius]